MAELDPAFWDTSALVPLCVQQKGSSVVGQLATVHSIVAWWATPLEIQSALARLLRMELLTAVEYRQAQERAEILRRSWREIQPHNLLRILAASLLDQFPLRAADALQLASALTWSRHQPQKYTFLSGDKQLLTAARFIGFRAQEV